MGRVYGTRQGVRVRWGVTDDSRYFYSSDGGFGK